MARRWLLRREDFSWPEASVAAGLPSPTSTKGLDSAGFDPSAVLALASGTAWDGLWSISFDSSRVDASEVEALRVSASGSGAGRPGNETDGLWWNQRSLPQDFFEETVLFALEHPSTPSTTPSGQALLWLDSPVAIDGLSVSLEIPRAASLQIGSLEEPWPLPAEAAADRLGASINSIESGDLQRRSSSTVASMALAAREQDILMLLQSLPAGTIGAWLDPGRLLLWLQAVSALEQTLPATSGGTLGPLGLLEGLSDYGVDLAEIGPVLLNLSEDRVVLRTGVEAAVP